LHASGLSVLQLEQGGLDGLRRRHRLLATPLNDLAPENALAWILMNVG
jgi:hypothetical protein